MLNRHHIFILLLAPALLLLGGCTIQKTIDASHNSVFDPDYLFTTDISIMVDVYGDNEMESKFYLNSVVSALKGRGFTNVFSYKEKSQFSKPDIALYFGLSKSTKSYDYESPIYGLVEDGTSSTSCSSYLSSVECKETKGTKFGIAGYTNRIETLTGHHFSTSWLDTHSGNWVMRSFASSFDEGCSDQAIYEFLVFSTLKRLDFKKPQDYEYSVTMPEGYTCNY